MRAPENYTPLLMVSGLLLDATKNVEKQWKQLMSLSCSTEMKALHFRFGIKW